MSAPRFSVIIPAYNSAATLARAIDSVLAQSYPAQEIIVIDDGSSDGTSDVAARYGGKLRYIRQDNAGVSSARNHGAQIASGDWLAFLDADDWYYPDRLRLHAEWIDEDAALDFLTGDYEYRDDAGNLLGTSMAQHDAGKAMLVKAAGSARVIMDQAHEIQAYVADHFGDTHTLSVPRQIFLELGGYPLGYKVCEDVHLLTRLVARSHRIGVVCVPLGVYLIHASSATRRNPIAAQQENVRTLTGLERLAQNFPAPVQRGIKQRMQSARYNLACALVKNAQRSLAVRAVLPSLVSNPGWRSLRDVLSMLKG
ncbi:MAG: glycosyl transferase [Betaproteobacteria bacterium RBG_16_58_11]|nr:MAG: glycosyl transferase [Betaproteobacteria bacterium RBG_16_58_11]